MDYSKLLKEREKHIGSISRSIEKECEVIGGTKGHAPSVAAARLGNIQSILLAILYELQYVNDKGNGNKEGRE